MKLSFKSYLVLNHTNRVKTTFGFNFDLYQAFKQHDYTNYMQNCNSKKACKHKNLNEEFLFILLLLSHRIWIYV